MPKIQYLTRQRNGYYLRVRVPQDLLDIYKKKEIKRTLGTSDYYKAKDRLPQKLFELNLEFSEKRKKLQLIANHPDMLSQYTELEIERLAKAYFMAEYEKRTSDKTFPDDWGAHEFKQHLIDLEIDLQEYEDEVDGLMIHPTHHGLGVAKRFLEAKGITYKNDSDELSILSHYMSRALAELTRTIIQVRKKQAYQVSDVLFDLNKLDKQEVINDLKPKKTISEVFDEYLNNPADVKTAATKKSYDGIKNVVYAYWGKDKPIRDITRTDCKQIFDVLFKLPKHLKKKAPTLSVQQGIAKAQQMQWECISHKTINYYMDALRAIMRYAVREEYIDKNPADLLVVKVHKEKKRMPYTADQLQSFFGCLFYKKAISHKWHISPSPSEQKYADMFWMPLISLYTGARMNEICQLEIKDLVKEKDVLYFNITMEGDDNKSLKTVTSIRKIPVHHMLISIGLMGYIEYIESLGHHRLFYDLKTGATGKYSDMFTKRFAYHLKKYNIKFPDRDFHSFRHTFRDECRERDIPDAVVNAIGGWSENKNVGSEYGQGYKIEKLNKYLQQLKYDGLTLDHLIDEN